MLVVLGWGKAECLTNIVVALALELGFHSKLCCRSL
jgi:hypothetical protein